MGSDLGDLLARSLSFHRLGICGFKVGNDGIIRMMFADTPQSQSQHPSPSLSSTIEEEKLKDSLTCIAGSLNSDQRERRQPCWVRLLGRVFIAADPAALGLLPLCLSLSSSCSLRSSSHIATILRWLSRKIGEPLDFLLCGKSKVLPFQTRKQHFFATCYKTHY